MIKSLYHRAEKICLSRQKFRFQNNKIKICMSWSCYPSFSQNLIIKGLITSPKVQKEKDDRKTIWIRLPYLGNIGSNMKKLF